MHALYIYLSLYLDHSLSLSLSHSLFVWAPSFRFPPSSQCECLSLVLRPDLCGMLNS